MSKYLSQYVILNDYVCIIFTIIKNMSIYILIKKIEKKIKEIKKINLGCHIKKQKKKKKRNKK